MAQHASADATTSTRSKTRAPIQNFKSKREVGEMMDAIDDIDKRQSVKKASIKDRLDSQANI